MKLTHSQISEILSNYTSSSEGFVTLQSLIMNSLMYHERELFVSENAHEQCNGFRSRRWYSHGFEFSLRIPRSRSGNFYPILLGVDTQRKRGTCQIVQSPLHQRSYHGADRRDFHCVYGRSYSKQQVSHLAGSCREDVERWLCRSLSSHYLAVYIDATFISTRRDRQVSKEAYYTILGVLEDGSREVLTVVNHPREAGSLLERRV
ncbi:transposase [Prevotella corporis]|uniref:transposase n=1 Tax=Prevotella corporis TaxID=28128 RepID=UPI0023655E03|nr:transposase [Prevotella corporis]